MGGWVGGRAGGPGGGRLNPRSWCKHQLGLVRFRRKHGCEGLEVV